MTVAEYIHQFESPLNEVEEQMEELLISFFIKGLKLEIKQELNLVWHASLQKVLATTRFVRLLRATNLIREEDTHL